MAENVQSETAVESEAPVEEAKIYTVEETLNLALKLGEAGANATVAQKLAAGGGPEAEIAKLVVKLYDIAGRELGQKFRAACESIGVDIDKVFEEV